MSPGAAVAIGRDDQYWRERLAPTIYGRLIQSPRSWNGMSGSPSRSGGGPGQSGGAPDLDATEPNNAGPGQSIGPVDDAHSSPSTSTSNATSSQHHTRRAPIPFPRAVGDGVNGNGNGTTSRPTPARRISPDHYKRSPSASAKRTLNRVPEDMEVSAAAGPATYESDPHRYYGSMSQSIPQVSSPVQEAPDRFDISYDEDSDLSEEEEEWLLDEELAKQGLYRGNMKNLFLLYSLVPLSAGIAFVFLALIPVVVLPHKGSPSPFPYPPYLPYPLPEVLTAAALWSVSYLLRDFLYGICLFVTSWLFQRLPTFIPVVASVFSAILQSASTLFFRQLAVPILLVPYYSTHPTHAASSAAYHEDALFAHKKHHYPTWHDDAFRRVWWIALGWAAAEAIVGIKQGYENTALYRDVLVNVSKNSGAKAGLMSEAPTTSNNGNGGLLSMGRSPIPRALTPTNHGRREAVMEDVDATPTQREVQDRTLSMDSVERTIRPPNTSATRPGGGYTDSLSTLSNSHRGSQYEPLGLDATNSRSLLETQPLLLPPQVQAASTISRYDQASERILAENEIERDLDQLSALKSREDLEEIYGIPFICIPAFISCLHRINAILISLGSCLLLTSAYMRSTYSYHPTLTSPTPPSSTIISITALYHPSNKALAITAPLLLFIQTALTVMHTPWILPRIGIQSFVYVTLLVSLLLLFAALGVWEALT